MKYLNLSPGFAPHQTQESEVLTGTIHTFAGGEPHIKLDVRLADIQDQKVWITHRINSFNDLGVLCVAVDALKRIGAGAVGPIGLYLPYFPGARQDRRMIAGEPLTVKVYADIINAMGFDHVAILDPHSDVAPALLNNCFVYSNKEFVYEAMKHLQEEHEAQIVSIVSPDAGAEKKINSVAKYLYEQESARHDIIKCSKERDVSTGRLTNFQVNADDLAGAPCVIIDDICDGGGTFIGLAEKLKEKNAGNLYLMVTHGIFSKGFKELAKHFKHIYTTDSICNNYWEEPRMEKKSEKVTQIRL